MRTPTRFFLTLLYVAIVSMLSVHAATLTVTNTNDSGPGSLREALAIAQGGDTIDATHVAGTILLTSSALQITQNVSITGPGAGSLAVNGNAISPVFENSAANVTISGFTITNGSVGISNNGENNIATLTITNCTVSGNSGVGINNNVNNSTGSATLTITNCTVRGNSGGGISNTAINLSPDRCCAEATLTVSNCTISGNSASNGGGIYNNALCDTIQGCGAGASVTISNSTLSDNSAGNGGAIYNGSGATISNSTLSGNSATGDGGAIYTIVSCFANLSVKNCTMSDNSATGHGGGIFFNGEFCRVGVIPLSGGGTLGSTIINAGSSGENIFKLSGKVTSLLGITSPAITGAVS